MTKYVCNGANGVGSAGPQGPIGLTGPAGANGTNGSTGATGPQGPIGLTGPAGANGKNTLILTSTEAAGANCTNGGVKQQYGIDNNSNGTLDAAEINAALTKYVCNGANGAANAWSLTGNTGTDITINFIGTTDDKDLIFKRNNKKIGKIGLKKIAFDKDE